MKKSLFLLCCYTAFLTACSQQDSSSGFVPTLLQKIIRIGDTPIVIDQWLFCNETPFTLVHLHGNETTADTVARKTAVKEGIYFLQLQNKGSRLVDFRLQNTTYRFDPNRIFTGSGIKKTLALTSRYTGTAFREIEHFADSLLLLLHPDKPVVALHNNTDGRFDILQYRNNGLGIVHINPLQDADDFFITNDESIFRRLQQQNFNVVLDDATKTEDDGSLNVYCSRQGIVYVNVEAQHGHLTQQLAMLEVLRQILK